MSLFEEDWTAVGDIDEWPATYPTDDEDPPPEEVESDADC